MKPFLTIVIPTWNRKPLVSVAIDSICSQIGDKSVEVYVSDHGSTDGTFEMLKEKHWPMLRLFVCGRIEQPDFSDNFQFSFGLAESEWTWTFGDDDFMIPGALERVLPLLTKERSFLHVGEAARSRSTLELREGSLIDLCNDLGFLDITGFITGNIVRTEKLKEAVNSENWAEYAKTAFPQSLSLLEACGNDNSAFFDCAVVEAQDRNLSGPLRQEDDRGQRWARTNIGARYSYIIPLVQKALDKLNYKKPLKPSFWRYQSYYLWDRFINDTVNTYSHQIMASPENDIEHHFLWDLFAGMADYLDFDNRLKVRAELFKGRSVIDDHLKAIKELNRMGAVLDEYVMSHSKEIFPFNYIGSIGDTG